MTKTAKQIWVVSITLLLLITSTIVWWFLGQKSVLDEIKKNKELVVLTRNAPTTYYFGRSGPEGPEYDLVRAFAEYLGVKTRFETYDNISEVLAALKRGEGDLAAAGLTRTEIREQQFLFGPAYQTVQQQVVCRRGEVIPGTLDELSNIELTVIENSSYAERLNELKADYPELNWSASTTLNTEEILAEVWEKKRQCTLADSNIVAINQRYYPELSVAFPIAEEQQLTWVMRADSQTLQVATHEWFGQFEREGKPAQVLHRYYGHTAIFDYVDIARYHRRIRERLPKYKALFKSTAQEYGLSWMLLAAQAYQESHWDPEARSPTGVRGIMMLTRDTAKEMGVKDRLNPEQSITAGAYYLSKLIDRVPDSVNGPDRMKFALAAYNVGMGHVKDARELAKKLGKDPDTWRSLETVLPLLSKKKYYKKLQYGYARGSEPVRYLERIYNYRDILRQIETTKDEEEKVKLEV